MHASRTSCVTVVSLLLSWACAGPAAAQGWTRGKELSWAVSARATNVVPRFHAIVIGINAYQQPPPVGWETLKTARQDAEAVAEVLEKQYGFDVVRLFDREATRDAILRVLDRLATYTVDDAVLIYYAGHGMFDQKLGEGFWIPCDAKKRIGQRNAKEDWIWNSTLTKIIGASEARHVLVVADSCYGGSLFRGEALSPAETDFTWYRRAMSKPSRYLISSGDLEPVLDSGGKHSVFAQTLLNLLQHPDQPVFSASEVGIALREKVGFLTGQMVRMGPLAVASHAGGEFVFLGEAADTAALSGRMEVASVGPTRGDTPAPPDRAEIGQALKDAALMDDQGFTNSAQTILRGVMAGQPDNRLAQTLAAYFDRERREKSRNELRNLIDRLAAKKASGDLPPGPGEAYARPRILACIGPDTGGGTEAEADALLCRIALRSLLEEKGGVIVVERDALQDVLQEMDIGSSELADKRAQTAIGKLLPASILMFGNLIRRDDGQAIFLRLVDTETTRILGSASARPGADDDLYDACGPLADTLLEKIVRSKPLSAGVLKREGDLLVAGVGSFHAAYEGQVFELVQETEAGETRALGTARIVSLGEMESRLEPAWLPGREIPPPDSIRVQEMMVKNR